ncbi:protein VAPYRIN isoform X2 [Aplysia californica]|uniref:Protein VAPYRIN isoform X2 n=1 Tax=Aplysia californica TaxID=6500 RepID=A0ABM0ZXF2_APLCA|nr:protein VAPYRIN isoform X2 [Aplysia californica]
MDMNFEKKPPGLLDVISQKLLSQTPLHFACYNGDEQLLETLIGRAFLYNNNDGEAAEACVSSWVSEEDGINGWTPAHWAAFYGQLKCLMKLHVKPNLGFDTATHRSNTSPLHLAAQTGAVLCLKWLLQCGASKNRQDFMGETALHKASKAGNADSAAMLIAHGCSLNLKNHRGMTPVELAEESGYHALAQYLRRAYEQSEYGGTTITREPHSLPLSELNPPTVCTNQTGVQFAPSDSDRLHPYISMNGEVINNSGSRAAPQDSMDLGDSEMQDSDRPSIPEFFLHGDNKASGFGGTKRSFDSEDDDLNSNKRRCFGEAPGSPVLPQSSVMDHQASLVAQQGYDSSFMNSIGSAFH